MGSSAIDCLRLCKIRQSAADARRRLRHQRCRAGDQGLRCGCSRPQQPFRAGQRDLPHHRRGTAGSPHDVWRDDIQQDGATELAEDGRGRHVSSAFEPRHSRKRAHQAFAWPSSAVQSLLLWSPGSSLELGAGGSDTVHDSRASVGLRTFISKSWTSPPHPFLLSIDKAARPWIRGLAYASSSHLRASRISESEFIPSA
eukprot:scaffold259_cov252-Pinguiococcus_pyrenoidosus.AAC.10